MSEIFNAENLPPAAFLAYFGIKKLEVLAFATPLKFYLKDQFNSLGISTAWSEKLSADAAPERSAVEL